MKTPNRKLKRISLPTLAVTLTTLPLLQLIAISPTAAATGKIDKPCTPAEEYIRSSRYLKKQKHIELSEAEIGKTSEQISLGCQGGARRFEDTIEVLSKAGYPSKVLIQTALDQSRSTDERTDLFLTVFQVTFARDGLDLTAQEALNAATRLTQSSRPGETSHHTTADQREAILKSARKAFKEISLHCIQNARQGGWELPKPDCARLATNVALPIIEEKLNGSRVSETLREFVEFTARASEGPAIPLRESLNLGQELLSLSETAPLEYIKGWRHAVSEEGLRLTKNQASEFTLKLIKQAQTTSNLELPSVKSQNQKR